MDFSNSERLAQRLRELVPGGSHTYAKGADQYPQASPAILTHGLGSHVWDADGNEFIEYGMGLRAVGLGHAYPSVVDAVRRSLDLGTNFTRPAKIELECAERFCDLIPTAEMVKFTKDGSTATSAALKLARRATGRDKVAICAQHPFFSYDDWFIATTTMDGGIPADESDRVAGFTYNDVQSVRRVFDDNPDQIAARVPRTCPHRAACRWVSRGATHVVHDEWSPAGLRRDDHRLPILAARCSGALRRHARTFRHSGRRSPMGSPCRRCAANASS